LVVNAIAKITQANEAIGVFFAVSFGVVDGILNLDIRLGWFVNGVTSLPAQRRICVCDRIRFGIQEVISGGGSI
jgi:hypothetical protein